MSCSPSAGVTSTSPSGSCTSTEATRPRRNAQEPQGALVPLIDPAARALDGLSRREHFTDGDDRVFVNALGDVLGQDLLRRRLKRALKAAELPPLR